MRIPPCAGTPPRQGRSPLLLCNPASREAFLVRGTILRIADLRFKSAHIRVAVRRPTSSRRMVELLPDHHRCSRESRSSRRPGLQGRSSSLHSGRSTLTPGAPPPANDANRCRTSGPARLQGNDQLLLDGPFHIRSEDQASFVSGEQPRLRGGRAPLRYGSGSILSPSCRASKRLR